MSNPGILAAAAEAEAALAAGRGDAHDCMVAALGRAERRDFPAAEALIAQALAAEPGNAAILTGLALIRRRQSRFREAVLACDAAIRAAPTYADAWLERGSILASGGSNAAARDSFAQAIRLNPALAQAHAGLAALCARDGDAAGARSHGVRALGLDPANAVTICALASADIAEGEPAAARDRLEPLIARLPDPSADRSLAYGLLGDAQDRLNAPDAAYQAYAAAKADFAVVNAPDDPDETTHLQFVEALNEGFAAVPDPAWRAPSTAQPESAAATHVFLLGYPRSGTTLLENILATLPGVSALEERPTLAETDLAYLMGPPAQVISGLAAFSALPEAEIAAQRAAYWNRVTTAGIAPGAPCFVDMDPLKGTRLPLIARLFPEARILVMRRDPRDVVWSCFRTNFAMTSGTLEYTDLTRAARHYDALMRLTAAAMERLDLAFHEVHYHRLVQDFDATTQEICAFLGQDWSEDLRRFDRTARSRGVATASASQVRRGLYDGTRQWERYAAYLEPVMPILQPWIDRFGYA